MNRPIIRPPALTAAVWTLVAQAGLAVVQVFDALLHVDWLKDSTEGYAAVRIIAGVVVALIDACILLAPVLLIRRGSRLASISVSLIGVWQLYLFFAYFGWLAILGASTAVVSIVLIWLPDSRHFITTTRQHRAREKAPPRIKARPPFGA